MGKRKFFNVKVTDRRQGKEQFGELPLNLDVSKLDIHNLPKLNHHVFPARFAPGGLECWPGLICDNVFVENAALHVRVSFAETEAGENRKRPKGALKVK